VEAQAESQAAANAVAITLDTTGAFTGRPSWVMWKMYFRVRSY